MPANHFDRRTCVVCGTERVAHTKSGLPIVTHRYGERHRRGLRELLSRDVPTTDENEREAMLLAKARP